MPLTASRALIRQIERWFIRSGVPQLIADHDVRRHGLPRMLPFLAFVAVTGLAWLVPPVGSGPLRSWTVGGLVLAGLAAATALRLASRRLPGSNRVLTGVVLGSYGLIALAVPLAAPTIGSGSRVPGLLTFLAGAVLLLAGAGLATTYGLIPLLRSALRHAIDDMRNSVRLQSRALPMLLFVTLFFFFTGELWQAMNRLSWWRLALVLALFAAVTILAAAGRLRDEIGRVEQDLSPQRLAAACQGTPLGELPIEQVAPAGPLRPVPLTSHQLANLLLVLATRQLVQAFVVGLGLFTFFLLLGVIMVEPATAEQWIGAPPVAADWLPALPVALPRNAALLAGFGSMYFAVTSMSDAEHRRQFFAPILDQVERMLAVRAVYLAVRAVVEPPVTAPDGAVPATAPEGAIPVTAPEGAVPAVGRTTAPGRES